MLDWGNNETADPLKNLWQQHCGKSEFNLKVKMLLYINTGVTIQTLWAVQELRNHFGGRRGKAKVLEDCLVNTFFL